MTTREIRKRTQTFLMKLMRTKNIREKTMTKKIGETTSQKGQTMVGMRKP